MKNTLYLCDTKVNKTMETLNLKSIIEFYNVDIKGLANTLFPHNNFPLPALHRAIRGETKLDSEQIALLADYLGVLVADLYTIDGWKASHENMQLTITKGPFKATLFSSGKICVYKDNELIDTKQISNITVSVTEFINHINKLIKSY